jgi:hypothetical protein
MMLWTAVTVGFGLPLAFTAACTGVVAADFVVDFGADFVDDFGAAAGAFAVPLVAATSTSYFAD